MIVGGPGTAVLPRYEPPTEPTFERPGFVDQSTERDFGRPADARLHPWIQAAWGAVDGAVRAGVDLLVPEEGDTPPASTLTKPLDRARDAQRALVDEYAMFGSEDRIRGDGAKVWRTEAWPLGQVLHGRVLLAMQGGDWSRVDGIFRELEAYRIDDGFVGGVGTTGRYYDDNEWIGLAALQAYRGSGDERYLRHAERTFRMVQSGEHPDGGLYWLESDKAGRHACSVAPAGELALGLYEATGEAHYLDFAQEQAAWLNRHLRLPNGLYADSLRDSGKLEATVYSYNQGAALGLDVGLFRATGDRRYLERAQVTANATLDHFTPEERLWKQAPAFTAIFFRNLLALESVAPNPRYLATIDSYLDRVWTEGRNPETGIFDSGGIGAYEEPGGVLDQGALSQLFAARALPREAWGTLT